VRVLGLLSPRVFHTAQIQPRNFLTT
jgi:hypothetical protein